MSESAGRAAPPRRTWVSILTSLPVRALVTAVLLAVLATTIDWDQLADRMADGEWGWFAAGAAVLSVALAIAAGRWLWLLRSAEITTTGGAAYRAFMAGSFANNFLPTGFGGDAVRALMIAPRGQGLARASTSVIIDRATGFACLIGVAWIVLPFDSEAVPEPLVIALAIATALGVILAGALAAAAGSQRLRSMVPERIRPLAAELARPVASFLGDRALVVRVTALGLLYQGLTVASLWLGSRAIGLDLSFSLLACAAAVVLLATIAPVSIAGFGVREGGFVLALDPAGVSATDATLLSLLSVALLALASLPGAFALMTYRRKTAAG